MPRFWLGALLLGALMSTLYGWEFVKNVRLIFFTHQRIDALVVSRKEDQGYCEIGYRYELDGQSIYHERLYRFPETIFIKNLGEGEKIRLIRGAVTEIPLSLVRFEIFSSLGLLILALLLMIRSLVEIKLARGQRAAQKLSRTS